ncbi:MAG: hypothetical protein Q7T30_03350 [Planctomycetota bacterium]|nr:hypothetical protein [Planctomycetota bacterium]
MAAVFATRRGPPPAAPAEPGPAPGAAAWRHELELAQVEAQLRGVDLLLWFHDPELSDFMRDPLRHEVFDDDEIRRFLQQSFRIVELRHSRAASLPALPDVLAGLVRVIGMNADGTRDRFIPAVVLVDVDGRPYAVPRSYVAGDGAFFAEELVESCSIRERRDAAFAAAASTSGLERAKALATGLAELDRDLVIQAYVDEAREIAELDPDDAAGLGDRHARLARMGEVAPMVREVDDVALAALPEASPRRLKELLAPVARAQPDVPEVLQAARFWVVWAEARLALDEKDFAAVARDLEAVRAMAPESCLVERLDEQRRGLGERRAAAGK